MCDGIVWTGNNDKCQFENPTKIVLKYFIKILGLTY